MNATKADFIVSDMPEGSCKGISPAPQTPGSDTDEESLMASALLLWSEHDTCVARLAPILYMLCKKLKAQGKKGKGFRAWLVENNKNPTTAYRWIREYTEEKGIALPNVHKAKAKHTSCHLAQSSDTANAKATVGSSVANPAWHISQMNESEQIALLDIGSFAETLSKAKELIEKLAKEFQSASQSYDPQTQELAVYGDQNYQWTPPNNSAEIARAQAYMVALTTTLSALNREAKQARALVAMFKKYIEKLNNNNQQEFFQVVPKKVPLPVNELQLEVA
ncbi:hypothetical protein P8935_24030 [Telmatobacter sp. DSM 110680]|uniref:Uncharacterized protein n=1 Tax=Telmatobacter sp. DSM 110680 TaxID=3036704 RepID=A0AAU7DKK9_9BACT